MRLLRLCPRCLVAYSDETPLCARDGERMLPPGEDPLIGKVVNSYRIEELQGMGGMARVYRASHTFFDRIYAIKFMHGHIASQSLHVERFRREAKVISRLSHPNVVAVLDFGATSEGHLFIVMEWVSGRTLLRALDDRGGFPIERIASIIRQIGIGLAEASGARNGAAIVCRNGKLTGKALFVIDPAADVFLVTDAQRCLHLVDAGAGGLSTRPLTIVDTTRPVIELTLNGTPARQLSGSPEDLLCALDVARVMLAADTLGAAQNMLGQAVIYAGQREQFNRPIATFQAVKHMCAEMAAELEPCRAFVWYAAHALNTLPAESRLTACHLKAHLAEVGQFVARTATEVHGGMGFTDLVGLHYWFKRIGFNRQMLGTPERLREEAARLQGLVA